MKILRFVFGLFAEEVSSSLQSSKKQISKNFIYKLIKKYGRSVLAHRVWTQKTPLSVSPTKSHQVQRHLAENANVCAEILLHTIGQGT